MGKPLSKASLPKSQSDPETDEILEACRRDPSVLGFFVFGWLPAAHHEEWIDFVMRDRLDFGISAPPAFAKTNWIGVVLSAWYLGHHPDRHVIYTSKTGLQAEKVSNAVRDTIEHNPRYHAVFPNALPNKDRGWGEKEWYLQRPNTGDKDASFFAVGIGGPILNARGDLILIDDPQDKTTSGTPFQREKAIAYVKEQVMTRKTKNGRAGIIMTRWHQDDVAGYYIKLGVKWLTFPALRCQECDHGKCSCGEKKWKSTWPKEWTTRKLLKVKNEDPIMFEKVYQGNPRSEENTLFHESAWQYYDKKAELPEMALRILVLDTAQKEEEQSSYSVIAHWGKAKKGGYYLLDLYRGRPPYPELLRMVKSLYTELLPDEVYIEEKSSGTQLIQSLEAETGIPVVRIKPQESKWERARAISPIQVHGRCYLPRDKPWVYDFIEEHAVFIGRFTDQVDTTAHALKVLREIGEDMDMGVDTVAASGVNRWHEYGGRETPDKASFDWVAAERPNRWKKFSGVGSYDGSELD